MNRIKYVQFKLSYLIICIINIIFNRIYYLGILYLIKIIVICHLLFIFGFIKTFKFLYIDLCLFFFFVFIIN